MLVGFKTFCRKTATKALHLSYNDQSEGAPGARLKHFMLTLQSLRRRQVLR